MTDLQLLALHHRVACQGAAFHTDEVEPVTALFGDLFQSYVQDALCDGHFVHSAPMLAQSPRRVKGFGKSCHSAQIM